MKTFDRKDVLSALTLEEAEQYKGKEGYFANNIKDLQSEVNNNRIDTLCEIKEEAQWGLVFQYHYGLVGHDCSSLFLPTDKVKVEEKKWRAFKDFNEFKYWTGKGVGSVIVYRDKLTNDELEAVITRSKLYENFVEIGAVEYTFKELFDQWEWLSNRNEWQPFGVEEC